MSEQDLEHEPVPGLPHALPAGENLLWQGQPQWKALTRHVYKIRWVAGYLVLMLVARAALAVSRDEGFEGAIQLAMMAGLFTACLGAIALIAWLQARGTVYTITTRRVVMRIGALAVNWNLPFKQLASADLAVRDSGDGDIVLHLGPGSRIGWLLFWPHVQPGHVLRARPALRFVREPERVARILREAVTVWGREQSDPINVTMARESAAPAAGSPELTLHATQ